MIETSVMYVSPSTQRNVVRIDETATSSGISTAGSVPKTKSRIRRAPTPPSERLGEHARAAGPTL